MTLTYSQHAQLRAYEMQNRAAELGLTAQDIRDMDWQTYNRVFGHDRPTPAQAALTALSRQQDPGETPAATASAAPQPLAQPQEPGPQGIDPTQLTLEQYAALRGQLGIGVSRQEGRGIFHSVNSRSEEYRDAVRAQSGRTALNNAHVQEPPRLEGRYVRQDDQRDTRSAAARFSNASTAYQL
jgi:hypothetical protein